MNPEKIKVDKWIYDEIKRISGLTEKNCQKHLIQLLSEISPKQSRTGQQNKALHVDCSLIAQKLNEAGLDMRVLLKPAIRIDWTMQSVKDYIFKPIMKAMYGYDSTTQLEKHIEIDKVHDTIMRELGEKHGIEHHPFPNNQEEEEY